MRAIGFDRLLRKIERIAVIGDIGSTKSMPQIDVIEGTAETSVAAGCPLDDMLRASDILKQNPERA
jgi:hypothetical protein